MLAAGLTACNDLQAAGDKGFVSGDGVVRTIAATDRKDAVSYEGRDLDGKPLSLSSFRGTPLVVTVWGAWCTYCRADEPAVQAAADQLKGTARFVGIDLRDSSPATALAYVRNFGVDYPSFYSPDGEAMLAFPGVLTPRSIPAFVVLDAQGRVAASIIGSLPSRRTLVELVQDVSNEATDG